MTDIDTLAGAALNRAIAEALGWRWIQSSRHAERWNLIAPDNTCPFSGFENDALAAFATYAPDYAHDLNAALALPCAYPAIEGRRKPDSDDRLWAVFIGLDDSIFAIDENLTTAYCRAWLKYRATRATTGD